QSSQSSQPIIVPSSDQPSQPIIVPSSSQSSHLIIAPSSSQSSQLIMLISQSTPKPNPHYTRTNFTQLVTENETLKNEIELLKAQFTATKEELETYKSPGTTETLDIPSGIRQELDPSPKKRKTLPFAQLLTNNESWQKLKEPNKEAEKKLEEAKQKKELAAQKKIEQQCNLEQKKEEHERKKREREEHQSKTQK
ncbi:901_t:CDS:2, partial [Racocetra fulgida]